MVSDGRIGNEEIAQQVRLLLLAKAIRHPFPWHVVPVRVSSQTIAYHIVAADGEDFGAFGPEEIYADTLIMDVMRLHKRMRLSEP